MQIANTIAAKLAIAFVAVATVFSVAMPAQAQTAEELQKMIADLMAQVAALQGGSSTSAGCTFTMSLTVGSQGAEVTCLQNYLIGAGHSIPAGATGYFGAQTQAAVAAWQAANGVSPAAGYFGPVSQAKYKALVGTSTGGSTGGSTSGDLEGGAGDIGDADWMSSLNNEDVGEGDEDVEVAGLEIEADGSDIELTAVSVDFDYADSAASDDFDDYATEVSIWLDGEEVGRVDVDDMDDDDWSENISLEDAIIREGETGELVIAVTAANNIDGDDLGENWNVGFQSVRFRDAQNATVTDTSTGDIGDTDDNTSTGANERQFSFESFATAADLEFKVSSGDDEINDARSISVSSTTETDAVELFSFEIELEGNSDVVVDELPVDFTAVGADVDEILSGAELVVDGDVIGSEAITSSHASTSATVTFDNLDWTIEAGDTVEVIVRVDVNELTGNFGAGDTLEADVNPDDAGWDIEDEEGDDLEGDDKTGSASSDAHAFYADGIQVAENDTTDVDNTVDGSDNDYVTLTIKFDVTAFGKDAYIQKAIDVTAGTTSTGAAPSDAVGVHIQSSDTGLTTGAVSTTLTSTGDEEDHTFLVEEGETETFTLRAIVSNSATSTLDNADIRAILTGVSFSDSDSATDDHVFTSNITDIKTEYAHIAD